jgi:hypothetical protein
VTQGDVPGAASLAFASRTPGNTVGVAGRLDIASSLAALTEGAAAFDLGNPPEPPPAGCVDPVMWQVDRSRFEPRWMLHNGRCESCRPASCPGRPLARAGPATAMGTQMQSSPYWTAFAGFMPNPAHVQAAR